MVKENCDPRNESNLSISLISCINKEIAKEHS